LSTRRLGGWSESFIYHDGTWALAAAGGTWELVDMLPQGRDEAGIAYDAGRGSDE